MMDEVLNILHEARPRPDVYILLLESAEDGGRYTVCRTINHGLYDPLVAPEPRKTIIVTESLALAEQAFSAEVKLILHCDVPSKVPKP